MTFTQKIKSFFAKVASWFKMTTAKSDELISKYAPIAVDVLQKIKSFNDSAAADAAGEIISSVCGKYDMVASSTMSLIRTWIRRRFPEIIAGLGIAIEVSKRATFSEKLKAASEAISKLDIADKSAVLQRLSAELTVFLEDGKISINEAIILVDDAYKGYKNKIND